MITSRDRVIRALGHEAIDRAPRDLWATPEMESLHADEVAEMCHRYPSDILRPDIRRPQGDRARGSPHEAEQHTSETLDKASFAAVNRACAATSRFVLGTSDVRPLERLMGLRDKEAASADLPSPTGQVRDLVASVHDFHCREMSLWASTDVDGVVFTDTLGAREGLAVSPQVFREVLKPLYQELCEILHENDKFAFFHGDGDIEPIFGDLVEIGVDAIHADPLVMNLESLAERYRHRVTFWGAAGSDRTLRSGTREEVRAAVRRVRAALDFGQGGLIAQCHWSPDIPFRNVAAAFEQWLAPMPIHAHL